jgi:hypothetical protein
VRVQLSHYRLHTSASAASPPPKPTVYHPTLHSFLSSSPLSLLLLPSLHHPPPSLLPSLTPPSAAAVLHAPFLPTALSKPLRLCLPFRGPRTSTLLQSSSPRPQGAPFHLQHRPASGLPGQKRSLPLHPTYTRNTATYTHTHTLTTYNSPKHTWTRTITLAQLSKQPQAKFPSVPPSEADHTPRSISRVVCPARYCTRHPTCTSPDSSSSTP